MDRKHVVLDHCVTYTYTMGNLQHALLTNPSPTRTVAAFTFPHHCHCSPPSQPPPPPPLRATTQPKHFIETGPIVLEMGHREN